MAGRFGIPGAPPAGARGGAFTIELANEARVMARFRSHKAGLAIQVDRAVEGVAQEIAEVAADLVAVDTHKTQENIRKERRGRDWVVISDRGGDKPEVPIYLETGTYKMAARPYLKPAGEIVMASRGFMRAAKEVGGLLGPLR